MKVWKTACGSVESSRMLRITSGTLGGRMLKSPPGETRPTQDKVRQAIFSGLGDFVVGARVLELFAGSGALGLEAWSRGAAEVVWVESDRRALAVLKENVSQLCPDAEATAKCVGADVFKFLDFSGRGLLAPRTAPDADKPVGQFDLVLADPPYDRANDQGWLEKTLPALEAGPILRPGGFLVFELGIYGRPAVRAGWALIWERTYGGTRVLMYRREEA